MDSSPTSGSVLTVQSEQSHSLAPRGILIFLSLREFSPLSRQVPGAQSSGKFGGEGRVLSWRILADAKHSCILKGEGRISDFKGFKGRLVGSSSTGERSVQSPTEFSSVLLCLHGAYGAKDTGTLGRGREPSVTYSGRYGARRSEDKCSGGGHTKEYLCLYLQKPRNIRGCW